MIPIRTILSEWKKIVSKLNDKGVPLPMVRDPNTLEGSVSLTLVVVSSLLVAIGIVGKWSKWLGDIDMNNALQFFYASCTLYFGHGWVHKAETADKESDDSGLKADDPDAPAKAPQRGMVPPQIQSPGHGNASGRDPKGTNGKTKKGPC